MAVDYDVVRAFVTDSHAEATNVGEELGEGGVWVVAEVVEDGLWFEVDRREEFGVAWGHKSCELGGVGA